MGAAGRDADRLWTASVSRTNDVRSTVGDVATDVKRILQDTATQGTRAFSMVSEASYGFGNLGNVTAGIVTAGTNLLRRDSKVDVPSSTPDACQNSPATVEQDAAGAADRV